MKATMLSPDGKAEMMHDIGENFKNIECSPAYPPFDICSFETAIQGPGNAVTTKYPWKMSNGRGHTFGNTFTWATVQATIDFRKNCPTCNGAAISKLQIDLHAKSTWAELGSDAAKSAGATILSNGASFIFYETVNAVFGLEGKNRIEHEWSVVVLTEYYFIRTNYIISQDHDGDGDVTSADKEGWNRIARESPTLIKGGDVMGIFASSGDGGVGHFLGTHANAHLSAQLAAAAADSWW